MTENKIKTMLHPCLEIVLTVVKMTENFQIGDLTENSKRNENSASDLMTVLEGLSVLRRIDILRDRQDEFRKVTFLRMQQWRIALS